MEKQLDQNKKPILKRNLEQVREGGADIAGLPWAAVEVKFRQNEQIDQWWEQTKVQAQNVGREPILIHRGNHQPWKVRMFGWLIPPQGGPAVRSAVDIPWAPFALYFKLRLYKEAGL